MNSTQFGRWIPRRSPFRNPRAASQTIAASVQLAERQHADAAFARIELDRNVVALADEGCGEEIDQLHRPDCTR
jgi:hypothetical protein